MCLCLCATQVLMKEHLTHAQAKSPTYALAHRLHTSTRTTHLGSVNDAGGIKRPQGDKLHLGWPTWILTASISAEVHYKLIGTDTAASTGPTLALGSSEKAVSATTIIKDLFLRNGHHLTEVGKSSQESFE